MEIKRTIRFASDRDLPQLKNADWLSGKEKLKEKIEKKEILVCDEHDQITGLLRFSWFWDYLPFINLIWVEEGFRREGRASQLIDRLERETEGKNYKMILASTQSNEEAQNFFRKVGFVDAGGFTITGQPFELIMIRYLNEKNKARDQIVSNSAAHD